MSNEKLRAALEACVQQIEQMKGMFPDDDGTIQGALDDALLAMLEEPFVTIGLSKEDAQAFYDMTIDTMENYGHDKEYVEDEEQLARIEQFCTLAARMQKECGTALEAQAAKDAGRPVPAAAPSSSSLHRNYMVIGAYEGDPTQRYATMVLATTGTEAEERMLEEYAAEHDGEGPDVFGTVFINDKGEMEIGS